jgi:hypothetical protein
MWCVTRRAAAATCPTDNTLPARAQSFTVPKLQHKLVQSCSGPGTMGSAYVAISASATLQPAVMRYNLGTYIRTDTPADWSGPINGAGVYGSCVQEVLGASGPGMLDMDGDGCGDLNRTQSPISACVLTQLINFTCVDLDGDGNVNLPVCMTWSTTRTDCRTAGMLPSSRSKCVCTSVNLEGMPVYGGPDQGVLIEPSAPTPSGTPPVVWPTLAPPPPPPPPSPPGAPPSCPAANWTLQNGGFELPAIGDGTVTQANMIGWRVDSKDGLVELLDSSQAVPFEGAQFSETCATSKCVTLYQDVATTAATVMYWQLQHRGRYGVDVANLTLGAPGAVPDLVVPLSTGTTAWKLYSGCAAAAACAQLHRAALTHSPPQLVHDSCRADHHAPVHRAHQRQRADRLRQHHVRQHGGRRAADGCSRCVLRNDSERGDGRLKPVLGVHAGDGPQHQGHRLRQQAGLWRGAAGSRRAQPDLHALAWLLRRRHFVVHRHRRQRRAVHRHADHPRAAAAASAAVAATAPAEAASAAEPVAAAPAAAQPEPAAEPAAHAAAAAASAPAATFAACGACAAAQLLLHHTGAGVHGPSSRARHASARQQCRQLLLCLHRAVAGAGRRCVVRQLHRGGRD